MGYSKEIYRNAMRQLAAQKMRAEQEAAERTRVFHEIYPRAAAIEKELATVALQIGKAVLRSSAPEQELMRLRNHNLKLQEEWEAILLSSGLARQDLEPGYQCKLCNDTGYQNGKTCNCLRALLRDEAYRELNRMSPLALSGFEDFSLAYYPDSCSPEGTTPARKRMESIFRFCQEYAAQFSLSSPNLLMMGGTGLGKTHLSLAIAKAAISHGYGVLYGSSQIFAMNLDKERFSDKENETLQHLLSCDLLILDDLGTEVTTNYIKTCVHTIIDSRIMSGKPSIVNTNLTLRELEERYSERLVSRLIGSYSRLSFMGNDIRQQKRFKRASD